MRLNAADPATQSLPTGSQSKLWSASEHSAAEIWKDGIGEGFLPTARTLTLEAGASAGFAGFGSRVAHNLALVSLSYVSGLAALIHVATRFHLKHEASNQSLNAKKGVSLC